MFSIVVKWDSNLIAPTVAETLTFSSALQAAEEIVSLVNHTKPSHINIFENHELVASLRTLR